MLPRSLIASSVFVFVFALAMMTACRPATKPATVKESGWIIHCSDMSDQAGSAHGSFLLFQTNVGGQFDTFTFASNVPPCATWQVRDVHYLNTGEPNTPRDYEITVIQHVDWLGNVDGTWDLVKMRPLKNR